MKDFAHFLFQDCLRTQEKRSNTYSAIWKQCVLIDVSKGPVYQRILLADFLQALSPQIENLQRLAEEFILVDFDWTTLKHEYTLI